jgi:hypothetical protein
MGSTDWGTTQQTASGERFSLAFGKRQRDLDDLVLERSLSIKQGLLDLKRCSLTFLDSFREEFRESLGATTLDQIAARANDTSIEFERRFDHSDYGRMCSGWLYWAFFLKGYAQYRADGAVSLSNVHLRYVKEAVLRGELDEALASAVEDEPRLIRKITQRFVTLEKMGDSKDYLVDPIVLYDTSRTTPGIDLHADGIEQGFSCSHIDGLHRIFSAVVLSREHLPFLCRDV